MPIYEYKCKECNYTKELIKRMKDDLTVLCDKCGKVMNIILQPTNFKINGWYTSKNGYSVNPDYMKAVNKKKKMMQKKG
jgi:putative FmdB family regulatory protein